MRRVLDDTCGKMIALITFFNLFTPTFAYYGQQDYNYITPCAAVIAQCTTDIGTKNPCSALYERYSDACSSQTGEVKHCSETCRPAFKTLIQHPMFSTFISCDCQKNNMCIKQKCILLEGCLGEKCHDVIVHTEEAPNKVTPYPTMHATTSTTTGTFITLPSTTMALSKINCESLFMRCMDSSSCQKLLQKRDKLCKEYKVEGSEICSKDCIDANTALLDSRIGYHMKTCTFDKVGTEVTRLINLIRVCSSPESPTTSETPSITKSYPTRPEGDCKRHYEGCSASKSCQKSFNSMIHSCKGTKCSKGCLNALSKLKSTKEGMSLYNCNCNMSNASKNCQSIRSRLNIGCRGYITSEPTTTDIVTVDNSLPPPVPDDPIHKLIEVSHVCEEIIKVTIKYSPKIAEPVVTTKDGNCKAIDISGDRVMTLELKYDESECGTEKVLSGGVLDYRNILYISNEVEGTHYELHCAKKTTNAVKKDEKSSSASTSVNMEMKFYKDNTFKTSFKSYPEDLGKIKVVYVELRSKNVSENVKTVVESCYATPEETPDYPRPHYLIRNGCRSDASLKMHSNVSDFKNTRFSFYRLKFPDQDLGQVYVHCNMAICNTDDEDCKLTCRQDQTNYTTYTISQGPYTFSAGFTAASLRSLVLLLTALVYNILR